jgi:hypothetical protein
MSNVLIMVNRNNADRNELGDIAAAVTDTGASVIAVDENLFAIEATAPAEAVPVIGAMEGVAYVRCVFNYMCGEPKIAA